MLNNMFLAGASEEKNFIEDLFSCYLYTGNGSTQTITNGIDLAGNGGLVWIKSRSAAANHVLVDSARGAYSSLASNTTDQNRGANTVTNFNSTGFTVTNDTSDAVFINTTGVSGTTYASWTFRKAPKFFDVVTYTGNGTSQNINHSLGSVPGMVIVKRRNSTSDWVVGHRRSGPNYWSLGTLRLNTTAASVTNGEFLAATDTYIGVVNSGASYGDVNTNGATYVAYLFAHDTTADGVIQCGSYTTDASGNATISLGWEPQFVLYKTSSTTSAWYIADNMRGITSGGGVKLLSANASSAEGSYTQSYLEPTSTGFKDNGTFGTTVTVTYLAIRRGPMRTPTDATKVFSPLAAANSSGTKNTTGFPIDLQVAFLRTGGWSEAPFWVDRLRGVSTFYTTAADQKDFHLTSSNTNAEQTASDYFSRAWDNTGFQTPSSINASSTAYWNFRRAPGFFDVICYTGTGVARTVSHNLGVVPELMIVKGRDLNTNGFWAVYSQTTGSGNSLQLQSTAALASTTWWNSTSPTATTFSVDSNITVNYPTGKYIAYLFATCSGISKVGGYTGNGTSQNINCGFTNGARFVLIKRTDSTGDWYVWDTARGIVAANDPHLSLNTTAAEITTDDSVDPLSTGFTVVQRTATNINVSGASYVFLSIA